MSYSVKEVFYTLQGEGFHSGRPAVFVRFSGCNMWSGREEDRGFGPGACSSWCDTDFVGGDRYSCNEVVDAAQLACDYRNDFVVLTGGEPALQVDAELIDALRSVGFMVAIETNGTKRLPPGIDWVCVSPKPGRELAQLYGNELKLVFPQAGVDPKSFEHLSFDHFYLQPIDSCEIPNSVEVVKGYCLDSHGPWKLSLQMHKLIGLP